MTQLKRHRIEARPDRMVILHVGDPNDDPDVDTDAAGWREAGWRTLPIDSQVIGFTGGVTNVLFDSGSGHATEVRSTVLEENVDPAPAPG